MTMFEMMSEVQEIFTEKLVVGMLESSDGVLVPIPFIPMMMSGPNDIPFSYVFDTERQKEIFNKINDRNDGWVYRAAFVEKREEKKC